MKVITIIKVNLLFLVLFFSGVTYASVFQTELEQSKWRYEGDKFSCQISHDINRFGELNIIATPAAPLTLEISSQWLNLEQAQAHADVVVPSWHQSQQIEFPSLRLVSKNKQYAVVKSDKLTFFLKAIAKGYGIKLVVNNRLNEPFSAVANGIGSQKIVDQFRLCYAQLLPKPYSYVRRVDLAFDSGSSKLAADHEQDLQAIALYVQADPGIEKVLVAAHADGNGHHLANLVLSKERADEVASRLVEFGLAIGMIEVRHHGERMPLVTNSTENGRALNRRVTVKLVKHAQEAE